MRLSLLSILMLMATACYCQTFTYPQIRKEGSTVGHFIPAGWIVLDSALGDLNKDNAPDVALVLQYKDSVQLIKGKEWRDTVVTQPRMLLLLFKKATSNTYFVASQHNSFILNHDDAAMEDPYDGITIKDGIVQISFQLFYNAGSWYVTNVSYKFRFQNAEFYLIGADYFSIHRSSHDYEQYSYNFLARKRSVTKGNDDNKYKQTSWKALAATSLKTLHSFEAPFTWEVEKDIFL